MSRVNNIVIAFCAIIILSSCQFASLDKLNKAEPVGSPFLTSLTFEYRDLANEVKRYSLRSDTTNYLAEKGLAAADGILVMPEKIGGWDINHGDIVEITQARIDLIKALSNGGRNQAPHESAAAQALFDCWALDYKKHMVIRVNNTRKIPCRLRFKTALANLKDRIAPMPADILPQPDTPRETVPAPLPAPAVAPAPIEPVAAEETKGPLAPIENAMFIVFFDWDKYELTQSSLDVLDAISEELKMRNDVKNIVVVGHADTSGDAAYNDGLSIQRAISVGDALISRGLSHRMIKAQGRGEHDLLVKTADNTREPSNRRVEITLE